MAQYRQPIPSSPVAPPRWPSLVQSVGGEAAIRKFTAENSGLGNNPNAWEAGVSFVPNEICIDSTPALSGVPCASDVFSSAASEGARPDNNVDDDVLYYWTSSFRSTFCSSEETDVIARAKLERQTSYKLESEFWGGSRHVADGLTGQYLDDGTATAVNSGVAAAVPYALPMLQDTWAGCAGGQRGMIHASPYAVGLLWTLGALRREGSLILDVFDNIVVAGAGYATNADNGGYSEGDIFMTPVVDVHLATINTFGAIDQASNTDLSVAYRAGLVKFDPCCKLVVTVDFLSVCG